MMPSQLSKKNDRLCGGEVCWEVTCKKGDLQCTYDGPLLNLIMLMLVEVGGRI